MVKRRFSSSLASDEITTRGYMVLTCAKCTTAIIAMLTVTSVPGPSQDYLVWDWYGFGLACMESYDLQNPFMDIVNRC
jgi:hypothetical protein